MSLSSGFKYHSLIQMIAKIDKRILGREKQRRGVKGGSKEIMFINKKNKIHGPKTGWQSGLRLQPDCSETGGGLERKQQPKAHGWAGRGQKPMVWSTTQRTQCITPHGWTKPTLPVGKKPKGFCDHGWGLWRGQSRHLEQQEEAEGSPPEPHGGTNRHTLLPSAPRAAAGPPAETRCSARAWCGVESRAKPLPRQGEGGERDKDSRLGQASKLKAQHVERKLTSGKIDKYSTT